MVGFRNDQRRLAVFQLERVVEYVGDFQISCFGIEDLGAYPDLNHIFVDEANLRVEVEQRSDLDGGVEADVVHVDDVGPLFAIHVCRGPRQLKGLPHDEAAKDLVESIPVFRLTDQQILQLGILHPNAVLRFDSGFETQCTMVNSLEKKIEIFIEFPFLR